MGNVMRTKEANESAWRQLILALVLSAGSVACEQTEGQGTGQSERQGTGQYFTENECPVVGNSDTHIYHLHGDRNYGQMLEENIEKRRAIAFALNREWKQRRPVIVGLVVGKANESGSCRFGMLCI